MGIPATSSHAIPLDGPADREECGKLLITEPASGRTTLATYRQTVGQLFVRSERGNSYRLPRP